MFRKILYPTDFSDCSARALEYVKKLREAGTSEGVLVHVVDVREIEAVVTSAAWLGETAAEYEARFQNEIREDAKKRLDEVRHELEGAGLKVSVKLPEGVPFKKILKIAEDEDVSLIVIGSHGKSNVREMLLGSVSEKVIRGSKRPVLVVKRDDTGISW